MEMIGNHHNHPLPPHLVTNNSDLERLLLFPLEFSNPQTPNSQAGQPCSKDDGCQAR